MGLHTELDLFASSRAPSTAGGLWNRVTLEQNLKLLVLLTGESAACTAHSHQMTPLLTGNPMIVCPSDCMCLPRCAAQLNLHSLKINHAGKMYKGHINNVLREDFSTVS